jgi:hypothetical protein
MVGGHEGRATGKKDDKQKKRAGSIIRPSGFSAFETARSKTSTS